MDLVNHPLVFWAGEAHGPVLLYHFSAIHRSRGRHGGSTLSQPAGVGAGSHLGFA